MDEQKKRGRPPLDSTCKSVSVHLRMSELTYDRACLDATKAKITLSESLRRQLLKGRDPE